jgi:ferredoxin
MAMKIEVDFDKCESNAVCMQVAPAYFEVRDDDFLYVLKEEVADGDLGAVQEAVDRCPKQAITLVEQ